MPELSSDDRSLLERLIRARGPSGDEAEVRDACRTVLEPLCDEVWEDAAGNLVSLLKADDAVEKPVQIVAHLDEIAMLVKRIEPDGRLTVTNLGGDRPMSFGQCAVDILGDRGPILGILSLGSLHRSSKSEAMAEIRESGADWEKVFVITGRSPEALAEAGVHPGTQVVLSTTERRVLEVGDLLGAHFMDDRALILAGIIMLRQLREQRERLRRDVYFVCSIKEEVTNAGAQYATQALPGEEMIALEVGPVAEEYGTVLSAAPILSYGDQKGLYSPRLIDRLKAACAAEEIEPQHAVLEAFASDASAAISTGQKPQTAVICVPTQNTHGLEAIHKQAVPTLSRVLTRFLLS